MRPSQRRLKVLQLVFGLGVAVVIGHLAVVMLLQHQQWLTRSYGNRWAFRDVPARRGAIVDRQGTVLVRDRATSSLQLYYWEFRRYHPVGCAVHGANLAQQMLGLEANFTYALAGKAFVQCLHLPLSLLVSEGEDKQLAQDLRFYLNSMLSSLTNRRRQQVHKLLTQATQEDPEQSVIQALGLDFNDVLPVFGDRLQELQQVRQAMLPLEVDLWQELQKAYANWQAWEAYQALSPEELEELRKVQPSIVKPRSDRRLRRLHAQVPYELTLFLAGIRERHRGLILHASVHRDVVSQADENLRWSSLQELLGKVSPYWGDTSKEESSEHRPQQQVEDLAEDLDRLVWADSSLSRDLQVEARQRIHNVLHWHFKSQTRYGRSWIEKDMDAVLRGQPGLRWLHRTRRNSEKGLWSHLDVAPGVDLRLSVDLRLQSVLEKSMDQSLLRFSQRHHAAIALIDVETGDVLALVSRSADDQARIPVALSWPGAGDIGSVAKPFIMLEHLHCLETDPAYPSHHGFLPCTGRWDNEGRIRPVLTCSHVHGSVASEPVAAIGESCNVFFYQAAQGLGLSGLHRAYQRVGLQPDVEQNFQKHVDGIPLRQKARHDERFLHRRAIGYGVQTNTLLLARAYAGLATGYLPTLSLVCSEQPRPRVAMDVKPEHLQLVQEGLRYCVQSGTAANVEYLDAAGCQVHAKTGTAVVGQRGSQMNNAWLAGYLGRDKAKLAFAAVVYRVPQSGAQAAGGMLAEFLRNLLMQPELVEAYL